MATERAGESATGSLVSLFVFGASWVLASKYVKGVLASEYVGGFGGELGLYLWFGATTLLAALVTFGAYLLYYQLTVRVGAPF